MLLLLQHYDYFNTNVSPELLLRFFYFTSVLTRQQIIKAFMGFTLV